MNEYLNKLYLSASSIGFLVALYQSAGKQHPLTALAGTALVFIVTADAFTWRIPGVPVHHPLGLMGILDIVGVAAGLAAIYFVASPLDRLVALRGSVGSAMLYIIVCLVFWILYPGQTPETYPQFLAATGLKAGSERLFAVIFVGVLLCLVTFLWLSFRFPARSALVAWRAYAIGVWLYFAVYFALVTIPIINHTWRPHRIGE